MDRRPLLVTANERARNGESAARPGISVCATSRTWYHPPAAGPRCVTPKLDTTGDRSFFRRARGHDKVSRAPGSRGDCSAGTSTYGNGKIPRGAGDLCSKVTIYGRIMKESAMRYLDLEQLRAIDPVALRSQKPYPWINPQGILTEEGFQ